MNPVKRTPFACDARTRDQPLLCNPRLVSASHSLTKDVALLQTYPRSGSAAQTPTLHRPRGIRAAGHPSSLCAPRLLHPRGAAFYRAGETTSLSQYFRAFVRMHGHGRRRVRKSAHSGEAGASSGSPYKLAAAFKTESRPLPESGSQTNPYSQPEAATSSNNGCRRCAWSSSRCAATRPSARPLPRACSRSSP